MYTAPSADSAVGKLFWSPLWDFDLAFDVTERDETRDTKYGFNNTDMPWFDSLRDQDPLFIELLKERWNGSDHPDDPDANDAAETENPNVPEETENPEEPAEEPEEEAPGDSKAPPDETEGAKEE